MLYEKLSFFTALKNSIRNVIHGIRYSRNSLYPVCVKSGIGRVVRTGTRYIGYSLYPVCAKKNPKGDPLASNDFASTLNILKIKGGSFCNIEKFSKKPLS